ncbi:MAG TPA: uracil-DNA glycosylase [Candidatus Binataceae bacterium]|jgi:DNA polymerase|nr:uracil-DNA glycosylase [Candidatus Binataceae bacterium]
MSTPTSPPDRALLLASLRDYVEQIREEGLQGLEARTVVGVVAAQTPTPASTPAELTRRAETAMQTPMAATPASPVPLAQPAPSEDSPSASPADASAPAAYLYPGLDRTGDLAALREFIGECVRCKLAPLRTNLVFGVGNPQAELMFVGEAPGADEDLRGEPFVGRAGQLLTDIIERGMGMTRAEVYICNVIKCRPPENRNPEADEVASCEPFLFRQIDLVRPRVIVGLGTFAVQAVLKVKTPISKLRGNWHQVRGIQMMPTFHPAYLLRNPSEKRTVWADIQQVMKVLGRPIPQRGSRG